MIVLDGEDDEKDNYKKAVLYVNSEILIASLMMLGTKALFKRNPNMLVVQYIFMRSVIGCLLLVL